MKSNEVILTAGEKRTVLAVFSELRKMPYKELNAFLGSVTILEMYQLAAKLRYEDYCIRNGITFEEMTEGDIENAELEMNED